MTHRNDATWPRIGADVDAASLSHALAGENGKEAMQFGQEP